MGVLFIVQVLTYQLFYGNISIMAATITSINSKKGHKKAEKQLPMGGVVIGKVPQEKINYLWDGWILENRVNVISGPPGVNKSSFAMFIASKLSVGLTPDDKPLQGKRKTLYYGLEDIPSVISERCITFGAQPGKIRIVDKYVVNKEEINVSFDDYELIENDIRQFKPRLVVFDVFRLCFGSMNITEAKHVNKVFAMLNKWCKEYNITVLLVHHSKANPKEREDCLEGSVALKRAVRSAAYISKFGMEGDNVRVIAPLKMSWSKEPDPVHFRVSSDGPKMLINMGETAEYSLDEILYLQAKHTKEGLKSRLAKIGVSEEIADDDD